jgi:hypothetical protein
LDDVKPIADLVNHAAPGAAPRFVDRVGDFQVQCDDRALVLSGRFPEATVWRFDLTTFDGQFDMRKLYVRSGNCAFPDDASIWTRKHAALLGDLDKGRTYCGPWEIFDSQGDLPLPHPRETGIVAAVRPRRDPGQGQGGVAFSRSLCGPGGPSEQVHGLCLRREARLGQHGQDLRGGVQAAA